MGEPWTEDGGRISVLDWLRLVEANLLEAKLLEKSLLGERLVGGDVVGGAAGGELARRNHYA